MSALEQMRPFFRLCQCVGFFPFRMEIDKRTKKFQQFSFSWRYPITWWFVTLILAQFFMFFVMMNDASKSFRKDLPITISISLLGSSFIFIILINSARFWVTLRLKTLLQVIQQLQIIEKSLREHYDRQCNIKLRTVIGCICTFIWVWLWNIIYNFL